MKTHSLAQEAVIEAYGLACKKLLPNPLVERCPVGGMYCEVAPNNKSVAHNHHDTELFFILSGQGVVETEQGQKAVAPGDIVLLEPFSPHTIENLDNEETLKFLAFWWEDLKDIKEVLAAKQSPQSNSIIVTAAPPTPNGALHVGHLSGPYLGADIYKRFAQYTGADVSYVTGTDFNQSYVKSKAMQTDSDAAKLAQQNREIIGQTFAAANMQVDYFYNPETLPGYNQKIQGFFSELAQKQAFIEKQQDEYFDQNGNYLHEAFISGTCPHCGSGSDGNCCEQCGQPNQTTDLIDAKALLSDGPLQLKPVRKLYFPLSQYKTRLLEYYARLDLSGHLLQLIDNMMAKELPDIAVTHLTDWGIDCPVEGFEEQKIYVWLELLVGYLTATEAGTKQPWQQYQQKIQFFGFDNSFYHLVFYPALLMANDMEDALPDQFIINEFLNLDGKKFSTSRGHLIFAHDFLATEDINAVRLYLSSIRPEDVEENFQGEHYQAFCGDFLGQQFSAPLNRLWQTLATDFAGKVPEAGAWNQSYQQIYRELQDKYDYITNYHHHDSFSPQSVMRQVNNLLALLLGLDKKARFIAANKRAFDLYRTNIALQALTVKVLSHALVGIAPDIATRLWCELGYDTEMAYHSELTFVPGGQMSGPSEQAYFKELSHER